MLGPYLSSFYQSSLSLEIQKHVIVEYLSTNVKILVDMVFTSGQLLY